MSFWDDFGDWAPVIGAAGGGAIGGPEGAAIGHGIGQGFQAQQERKRQEAANRANIELQREFAQNGIRWKVADAMAAGIHPLAALGAQTHSFQASVMPEPTANFSGFGQDLTRAMSATRTQEEKDLQALQIKSAQLDVEGKALDNQTKAAQLQKMQGGPSFPGSGNFVDGQGNSGPSSARVVSKSQERTVSAKGKPYSEPGAVTDVGWIKTPTGVVPVPSKDTKERIEDNMFHEASHFWRNNVAPNWGGGSKPPREGLPRGYDHWKWDHLNQEYRPAITDKDTGESVWYQKRARGYAK